MKTGIELIAEERKEQIEKHGFDLEFETEFNSSGELREAAIAAICESGSADIFKFPSTWDFEIKMIVTIKSYRDRLVIAGALIAAEIDRIQAFNKD